MTEEKIQKVFEEIRPNIKKLTFVFIPKMKQPSIFSHQDLEREAEYISLFHIRKKGRIDETKGKISTYLIRTIICHFSDLVKKSYKIDPILDTSIEQEFLSRNIKKSDIEKIDLSLYIQETLTPQEKKYVETFLNPPNEIQKGFVKNQKNTRKLVRQHMRLSPAEERRLRDSIRVKIKSIQDET